VDGCVSRSAEIGRARESLAAGRKGWPLLLANARRDPTATRVRVLCRHAEYLHTDIGQIEQTVTGIGKKLGAAARTMRRVQGYLQSVTTRGVRDVAAQMARLLDGPLSVSDAVLPALRRGRCDVQDVQKALAEIAACRTKLPRP